LDAVVEDCVNGVGVDLNTASIPLLARVAGLNQTLAENIIEFRNCHGAFRSRKQLLDVARLGARTFEQAAGFLRIADGDNPLDRSSVHPEAYGVVQAIAKKSGRDITQIVGDSAFLRTLNAQDFVTDQFGLPTIQDILAELEKPGRDPRPEFRSASFQEGVETLKDLKPGMVLEGTVTNVTNFGAFVDVGVHQDGLVHISALSHEFIKDPREVVKAGDIVKVKVMEVDIPRKRIALTMRMDDQPGASDQKSQRQARSGSTGRQESRQSGPAKRDNAPQGTMAGALAQAMASARKDKR
ncbi:helix-hairpin-helix domain-containing protein, partial [Marinobacter sp.]